jgi:hypothetical protein
MELRRSQFLVLRLAARLRPWHLLSAALLLRLPAVWLRARDPAKHAEDLKAAFTLARSGYLADPFALPTGPTAHVAPAYPALAAMVRLLTPSEATCMVTLSIILALVSSCNIAALLPVSRALGLPRGAGAISALLWVFPFFAWIELSPEHETPFIVTSLLALTALLSRTVRTPAPTFAVGANLGLGTGIAAYVAPTALPFVVFGTLAGAVALRWNISRLCGVLLGGVLALALVVAPYTLRNYHTFGTWFFMRDNFGIEFAMSNGPNAQATMEGNRRIGGTLLQHPASSIASAERVRDLGEVGYNRSLERATLASIEAKPARFIQLVAERLGYMLLPFSRRVYQRAVAGVSTLASIVGCFILWRSRYRIGIRCLAAAIGGYLLVYLVLEHDIRYMYPALFLESLVAGSAVVVLLRGLPKRHQSLAIPTIVDRPPDV